ncbi:MULTISPECIES: 1,4-alpha-glucan branching protein GlgB [unclassified Granulicatella]|uniref:1,4-alpha-glucan branching protein GlgB n=1 Tax=unclassified Granulicatella TaxID=2630493 RepID=UPI0010743268|nr:MULTISPECIES: 1,4-alpha-glucan branching protein GlgB [unclassified Granulicatella]MBF0780624.1 1,4-alpha-glucan branching protein GlgB [Granulicatella sp. 19428wC4_WM01]TFU94582.1 1,4-alpha-glucan branching protein GlgB [Granulicatella sp. WM01]
MDALLYSTIKDDIYLFNIGQLYESGNLFGNHFVDILGNVYCRFVVWAPNARGVSVIGDFNQWQPDKLVQFNQTGVWGILLQHVHEGECYKYIIEQENGEVVVKIDPFAQKFEQAPKDASIVYEMHARQWKDGLWQAYKKRYSALERPINIYEVHASSWKKHLDGRFYTFDDLIEHLIPYVKEMNYTHIEFMPLMEHPLQESWGYQVTGYYALSSVLGDLDAFCRFVEAAHRQFIGVIMDWVPGHFCRNANALAYFDGTPTFEYSEPHRADNKGWGTLNFDLGKAQVRSFLISNALFWLEKCHLDGLRVDAVSNMLYLDFDNEHWVPNHYGDNRNLEGITFLQQLNSVVYNRNPYTLMIAEESTAWDGVTRPVYNNGLGFLLKWNMGWMNDTLKFIALEPEKRASAYRLLTFSFMYAFNEQYILPFSHDEVVHGKNSLLGKTKGDRYNQFAMLRVLQAYLMVHPGKKLNFMGYEIGQFLEWRFYSELEWCDLEREFNREYHYFIQTLNTLYKREKALFEQDSLSKGLIVLDADNTEQAIISFIRQGKKARDFIIAIANFLPQEHAYYRVGVPYAGEYQIILNTEKDVFGGTWTQTEAVYTTQDIPHQHQPYSIECLVPSLSVLYLKPKRIYGVHK